MHQGQFTGTPRDRNELFGYRQDECPEYGCLLELTIQLAVIMIGKQLINNFQELILPRLQSWWASRSYIRRHLARRNSVSDVQIAPEIEEKKTLARWIEGYNAVPYPEQGLFDEYLEMVLQFAFITLFVAAFPLGPLFALLNNILEIRVDALKLVRSFRRPIATRVGDIGIWQTILSAVAFLSVITNGTSLGFSVVCFVFFLPLFPHGPCLLLTQRSLFCRSCHCIFSILYSQASLPRGVWQHGRLHQIFVCVQSPRHYLGREPERLLLSSRCHRGNVLGYKEGEKRGDQQDFSSLLQ